MALVSNVGFNYQQPKLSKSMVNGYQSKRGKLYAKNQPSANGKRGEKVLSPEFPAQHSALSTAQ